MLSLKTLLWISSAALALATFCVESSLHVTPELVSIERDLFGYISPCPVPWRWDSFLIACARRESAE